MSDAPIKSPIRALSPTFTNLVKKEKTLPLWLKNAAILDNKEYSQTIVHRPSNSKEEANPCLITLPCIK